MAPVRFVNRLLFRILVACTLFLILFNEVIIYHIHQSSWQQINCKFVNCTRILFVADPQLLGKTYERTFYSPFAIYDSDRYLQTTFERSLAFAQPNIICFLGDLLDEGSVASPQQFQSYAQRFNGIYKTSNKVQKIHIPGDNDIGGENGEYVSKAKVRRFDIVFMRNDLFDYENNLRFFKINRMISDYTNPDRLNNPNRLRIGVSHSPLLITGGPFLRSVIEDIDPHVIFSAHWHESRIFYYPSTKVINYYENDIQHFNLEALKQDHTYLEIMVPTASYRMGKTNIGIGFGVIENNDLRYTVLWSPNRFIFLITYGFWIFFVVSIVIVFKMMTQCPFRSISRQQLHYNRISLAP